MSLGYDYGEKIGNQENNNLISKSFIEPFQKSGLFINSIAPIGPFGTQESKDNGLKYLKDSIEQTEYNYKDPNLSIGQKIGSNLASLAGNILEPTSVALGMGFGKLGSLAFKGIAKITPEIIPYITGNAISKEAASIGMNRSITSFGTNRFASLLPENISNAVKVSGHSAGTMVGFTLPESFNENYDIENHKFNTGGFIKSIAYNGGIGFSIPPLAWALAHLHGKIFDYNPILLDSTSKVKFAEKAFNQGKMTEREFETYKNLQENPHEFDKNLKSAIPLIQQEYHPLDAITGRINIPFMKQNEMENLDLFFHDKIGSNLDPAVINGATDYIGQGILDRLKTLGDNPSFFPTMNRYLEDLGDVLSKKKEYFEKVDSYIGKSIDRSNIKDASLSQKDIFSLVKKHGFDSSELPFHVPDNVKKIAKQEIRYRESKSKLDKAIRISKKNPTQKYIDKIENLRSRFDDESNKLNDIHMGDNKILKPDEEIENISKKFFKNDKLPKNYQARRDYYRLQDLASINGKARQVLVRITAAADFELQQSYHGVLSQIMKVAEASFEQAANPQDIVDYLKQRLEKSANIKTLSTEESEKSISSDSYPIPEKPKPILEQKDIDNYHKELNENENIPSDEKKEFNNKYKKLKNFQNNQKALSKFVSCVQESVNVI